MISLNCWTTPPSRAETPPAAEPTTRGVYRQCGSSRSNLHRSRDEASLRFDRHCGEGSRRLGRRDRRRWSHLGRPHQQSYRHDADAAEYGHRHSHAHCDRCFNRLGDPVVHRNRRGDAGRVATIRLRDLHHGRLVWHRRDAGRRSVRGRHGVQTRRTGSGFNCTTRSAIWPTMDTTARSSLNSPPLPAVPATSTTTGW